MALTEYRRKRNFRVTAEPRGGRVKAHTRLRFVIQKHAASHLHYDFRLEFGGVLKSWAVPKGPSLDPTVKRLAMHVEDHPLKYGDFEGIIPQGEYGEGTVLLWDKGTWEPIGDGKKGYRDGSLKFILHGKKLQGGWMFVRRGGKRGDAAERHWFLFKERDEFAKPDSDITTDEPLSVTTSRDLEEIAANADRVWGPSGEISKNGRPTRRTTTTHLAKAITSGNGSPKQSATKRVNAASDAARKSKIATDKKSFPGKRAPFPKTAKVQLATLAKKTPVGNDWIHIHEIKYDG